MISASRSLLRLRPLAVWLPGGLALRSGPATNAIQPQGHGPRLAAGWTFNCLNETGLWPRTIIRRFCAGTGRVLEEDEDRHNTPLSRRDGDASDPPYLSPLHSSSLAFCSCICSHALILLHTTLIETLSGLFKTGQLVFRFFSFFFSSPHYNT